MRRKHVSEKQWDKLSPVKRGIRVKALQGLQFMRGGTTLNEASKRIDLDSRTFRRHIRGALLKTSAGWIAKPIDNISRGLLIKERRMLGEVPITVSGSKMAQLVGQHHAATKECLHSGNLEVLKKFDGVYIIDSSRKRHYFETDPSRIEELESKKENAEFYTIYRVA